MAKIDYEYQVTAAQVRRYQQVPLIDRLRWLEEICVFTKMVQQAPHTRRAARTPVKAKSQQRARPAR